MSDSDANSIVEFVDDKIEFENLVWESSAVSLDKAKQLIPNYPRNWIHKLIYFVANHRPFKYQILADFLVQTGRIDITFNPCDFFAKYIYTRGIIDQRNIIANDDGNSGLSLLIGATKPIKETVYSQFIQNDDIESFIDFTTSNSISVSEIFIEMDHTYYSVLDFICYCGAIDMLKFMCINGNVLSQGSLQKCVEGGSEEVIAFLISLNYSFNNLLRYAIENHHNTIARFLYQNYDDSSFRLPNQLFYYNTEMLLYFIDYIKYDINEQNLNGETLLHIYSINNDVLPVKFLLAKGADKNIADSSGNKPIDNAYSTAMKNALT